MLGETDENWRPVCARRSSSRPTASPSTRWSCPSTPRSAATCWRARDQFGEPPADWATKRRWVEEAFAALEGAGYHVGSAYTVVKDPGRTSFVYRDRLWQGADLVGLGVASFGHVNGVHLQNLDTWEAYVAVLDRGELPLQPRLPAHA